MAAIETVIVYIDNFLRIDKMLRTTKILVCTFLVLNGLSSNAMGTNTNESTFKGIKSINIRSDEGHISIQGGNRSDVQVHHQFNGPGVKISKNIQNGTLFVINDKKDGGGNCDLTLNVPNTVHITTELGAGNISLEKLTSDINLKLGAGQLKMLITEIPSKPCSLVFKTGAGNIDILLPQNTLLKYARRPAVWGGNINLSAKETAGNDYNFLVTANTGMGDITVRNSR